MVEWLVGGGQTLGGAVWISGAKHAALPELCACLLASDAVTLANVPHLQDVDVMPDRIYPLRRGYATMQAKLRVLGADVERVPG